MPNKKFVGKNANVILKAAGVDVDESVDLQLAVILTDSTDHPYVLCEQLMPIFPICKVKDWDACHGSSHPRLRMAVTILLASGPLLWIGQPNWARLWAAPASP